jgi:beta-phosphoglucomutase-like phosphatase (HAD superfamily)
VHFYSAIWRTFTLPLTPKPYIYQLAAQNLGIDPRECIVFEDSNAGVEAAFTAGIDVIAVPNEFTKNQDFSHAVRVTKFNDVDINTLL